jgi:hypothetical protein
MVALLIPAIWLAAAALPYFLLERRWQWRWQEVPDGEAPAHSGAGLYREAGTVTTYLRRAPAAVRAVAFSCLLFGELVLPLGAIATVGMFFFGMGIALLPILITGGKLYRAGLLLIRREPRTAYFAARNAARWSLWCTAVGLVLACVIMSLTPEVYGWPFVACVLFGAAVVTAQGLLILRVTQKHEDELFASSRLVRLGDQWVATDAA